MNKIKKISIVLMIIMLIVCILTNKTYAELNCNVNLSTSKDKVTYNETFSVYVKISNLQTTKGIIAIGASLSYDTNSLTLVDIEGENKWSDPFYNSSNGKITSFKNKLSTSNENILKITFKVNEKGKATNSAWIKISNFEISDGDEEKNCGGNSMNIVIEDSNSSEDNTQGGNNNPGDNTGNDNQGGNNPGGNTGNDNQGGNNPGGNTGNNNPGGSKPGSSTGNGNQNSGNNQINKPNTGTTKPNTNEATNGQGENVNHVETSNENTNVIENMTGENSTNDENVINDNTQNILEDQTKSEETKENKKDKKAIFYAVSVTTIVVIIGILFLIKKYWKVM